MAKIKGRSAVGKGRQRAGAPSEVRDQLHGMADHRVGLPGIPVIPIAPFDAYRGHARGVSCEDVAKVIADVETFLRRQREFMRSMKERRRMRLEMGRGVAANDARWVKR